MTTTLTISSGPLSRSKTYQNDELAQTVLNLCADRLGATGTPTQRLDAVLNDIQRYLIETARYQHRAVATQAAENTAGQIHLE